MSEAYLTVVSSESLPPGTRFLLGRAPCRIGRGAGNEVRVDEEGVALEHARIEHRYGRFIIEVSFEDALVRVNRDVLHKSRRLFPGDTLEVAGTTFQFTLPTGERRAVGDPRAATHLVGTTEDTIANAPRVLATSRFALSDFKSSSTTDRLRRDFDRLKGAFDAVSTLLNTFDLAALCERMLDAAFQLVPAEHGSVQLRRADGSLWIAGRRALGSANSIPAAVSQTVVDHVLERKESVLAMDLGSDERFAGAASIQASRVLSLMAVPLVAGEEVLGILHVVNASRVGAFREADLELLSAIGVGAGLVLSNNHLYRQLEEALERQVAFNETLKHAVEERTAELRERNRELSQTLTKLKTTQDQIIAREKLASLGTLTAGVAHELLNPMNFVHNFAKLLAEHADELRGKLEEGLPAGPPSGVRELLDDMEECVRNICKHEARVSKIVDSMRQLSQAKGDERTLTNLNEVLSSLASALSRGDPVSGPRIATSLDPAMAPIDLAARDVSHALLNVLQNALQAVQARMARPPEGWAPEVHVASEDRGEVVLVTVRDNGEGIPAEIRHRVFEPFFTTKPSNQGAGLGLSIAYDIIVKMHGGSIEITSEAGRFTELRIAIPRA